MSENLMNTQEIGKLYIVATPIGNLSDITLRALETLKSVDFVACEDTRVSGKLLSHYSISKPTTSLHHHSGEVKYEKIVNEILEGKNVAYCSDAGTPGISDPGNQLVQVAVKNGIQVIPIPGVSALTALVSVSGIDMQKFSFLGFPPHKKGRETFFKQVCESKIPVVYYESPHRAIKNFELLGKLGCTKKLIVGRELTKIFEEVVRGDALELAGFFSNNPQKNKGEFCVVVY